MRGCISLVSVLAALLAAGAGHAGSLTSATWFQVYQISLLGLTGSIPMTRTHAQLGATGSSTATSISVSLSYPALATTVFLPKTPNAVLDLAVQITQGGPQLITATPGMGGGSPGVAGTVLVNTALHAAMGVNASMFVVGQNRLILSPVSVGRAGQFTNTFFVLGVLQTLTADFHPWTPGTLRFTGLTSSGAPLPNVTVAGSFDLTPDGGGTVTLVSPSKITVDSFIFPRRRVSFSTLRLSFAARKFTVCHKAQRTLSVSPTSLPAHLLHGDSLGACE